MCIEYIAFRMVTQAHPYRGISMLMKRRGAPSTQIMRERVIYAPFNNLLQCPRVIVVSGLGWRFVLGLEDFWFKLNSGGGDWYEAEEVFVND